MSILQKYRDLKNLLAFTEETNLKRAIVVTGEAIAREETIKDGFKVLLLPWKNYLEELWKGNVVN